MRAAPLSCLIASLLGVPRADARVDFMREVKPIIEAHCVRCHGKEGAARGLRLHSRERAMLAVVKNKPEESRIYNAIRSGAMPPGPRKLTPAEIDTIRRWGHRHLVAG